MPPDKYRYPRLMEQEQSSRWVHKYCYQVLSGDIVANKWIKLAAERHFNDLERAKSKDFKYEFNAKRAQRAINFYQFIKHTKGELAGTPMKLMPWQQFIVGSIFGWVTKQKDKVTKKQTRRFRTAEVFVARKNGKSTLASGIGLYAMLADGEQGAEVYSAATTRDQARIVFDDAKHMLVNSDLKEVAKAYQAELYSRELNAKFRPLSSDANNLDGLNVHCALIDEIHAHKTREVYDVIETATGARTQPLIFVISTAGFILDGIATELWKYGEEILEGIRTDDTFFAALYTMDTGDDFTVPGNWLKANPCLGVSKKYEDMERLCNKAQAMVSARGNYLTKHCNIFVNSSDAWLDIQEVQKCKADINLTDYMGRECYIGLDLAQKLDLTAMSLIFPRDDGGIDVFFRHYLPEDALLSTSDRQRLLYQKWSQDDYLELTEGIATDYRVIKDDLRQFCEQFDVQSIGYDPYSATQLSFELSDEGLPMVSVPQNIKNLSEPSKEFEQLIMTQNIRYSGDSVFEYCCANAHIYVDANENIKPIKENKMSNQKIDSVVACITGLSLCVLKEPEEKSVYETRELIWL